MNALVTGGGGFLGGAIVRMLLERGDTVFSLSRNRYNDLDQIGVEQFEGDISDQTIVDKAVKGCDTVFHVAAKAGIWGGYNEYYRINVTGTENIINACRKHNVPRLIFSSSSSVVFNGKDQELIDETEPYPQKYLTTYPATKAEAEQKVLAANGDGLCTVSLRPHLIWGPGDNHLVPRLLDRVRSGQFRKIGPRENLVDNIYIDNAAEAHLLAADRLTSTSPIAGRAYFISQDNPMSMVELVDNMVRAGGLTPVDKYVPVNVAFFAGWFMEIIYKILMRKEEPKMTRFLARQLSLSHCFNIDAAKRDLDYKPNVSFEEGLSRLAESLK